MIRLGVQTSISGGVSRSIERAAGLGCNTVQIFSHNPRQWRQERISAKEVERFTALRKQKDINPVFIHASYLINLASISEAVLQRSVQLLIYELRNADMLGVEHVVVHAGSPSGSDVKQARVRVAGAIRRVVGSGSYRAKLLLENTTGEIAPSIEALMEIIDMCHSEGIGGICIDTCHAFSSGYDLRSEESIDRLISEIDRYIGLERLRLIHLNDSKRPLGSGIDRHKQIGEGFIGIKKKKKILSDERIIGVPMILETPKKTDDDDRRNLSRVLEILSQNR